MQVATLLLHAGGAPRPHCALPVSSTQSPWLRKHRRGVSKKDGLFFLHQILLLLAEGGFSSEQGKGL